jgi:hypothetical protein
MVIACTVACVKIDPDGGCMLGSEHHLAAGKIVATSVIGLVIELTLARSKMVAGSVVPLVIEYELASGKMKGNTPRRKWHGSRP